MRRPLLVVVGSLSLLPLLAGVGRAQSEGAPPEQEATPAAPSAAGAGAEAQPAVTTTTVGGSGGDAGDVVSTLQAPSQWGVGVRLRQVFMPVSVLHLFLKSASSMSQQGAGVEIINRKGEREIVLGLEYDNISPKDWNYLGANGDPTVDTYWTHFDNFGLISGDLSIIWSTELVRHLDLRYGAGFGLGVTTGQIDKVQNTGCSPSNYGDPTACHPPAVTCTGSGCNWAQVEQADGSAVIKAAGLPVYPIVNLLLGLRLRLGDHADINLEAGFRDVFYMGLGGGYFF